MPTGAFQAHWALGAVAALGVILSAAYFLWYYERAFFGPVANPSAARLKDLSVIEMTIALPVMALVFVVGFYPKPLLDITSGSVATLERRIQVGALPAAPKLAVAPYAAPAPAPTAEVAK